MDAYDCERSKQIDQEYGWNNSYASDIECASKQDENYNSTIDKIEFHIKMMES